MRYFVIWKMDIDAESAKDAALEALKIQRDPASIATVFNVVDAFTGKRYTYDVDPETLEVSDFE